MPIIILLSHDLLFVTLPESILIFFEFFNDLFKIGFVWSYSSLISISNLCTLVGLSGVKLAIGTFAPPNEGAGPESEIVDNL